MGFPCLFRSHQLVYLDPMQLPLCSLLAPAVEQGQVMMEHLPGENQNHLASAVVAQEETIINQLEISQNISSLLSNLLIQLSEESFQDIAQLLTAALRPAEMSESSSSGWGSGQLPEHFRAVGLNHPHNMLYLTSLLPGHFSRLQQLVSFMFIQLIINSQDCDLPDECHVMDVIDLLENNGGQLKKSWAKLDADEELYSCWCLLQLLDILVLKVGKE